MIGIIAPRVSQLSFVLANETRILNNHMGKLTTGEIQHVKQLKKGELYLSTESAASDCATDAASLAFSASSCVRCV